MRVLVVEDNTALRGLIEAHLHARGYAVEAVADGHAALHAAGMSGFDVAVLDLGLPDLDGLDVLRRLRLCGDGELPVIILTARDSVEQRVAGLDAGADDYVLKPFDVAELDARLRAVLRRPGRRLSPVYDFADLSFDTASRAARCGRAILELTPREANLFEELLRAGEDIVVRDALVERLCRPGEEVTPNALEAIVSRLRRKLASGGSHVRIETMRGIGYRLKAP